MQLRKPGVGEKIKMEESELVKRIMEDRESDYEPQFGQRVTKIRLKLKKTIQLKIFRKISIGIILQELQEK